MTNAAQELHTQFLDVAEAKHEDWKGGESVFTADDLKLQPNVLRTLINEAKTSPEALALAIARLETNVRENFLTALEKATALLASEKQGTPSHE